MRMALAPRMHRYPARSISSPDDFAQRVHRGAPGDHPGTDPSATRALEIEAFRPMQAADLLWGWVCGRILPPGFARTLRYLTPQQRRQYGFDA